MKSNYKRIERVDLVSQLFFCKGLLKSSKDKFYIYFSDIQNKDLILKCIKNMEKYYIGIYKAMFIINIADYTDYRRYWSLDGNN